MSTSTATVDTAAAQPAQSAPPLRQRRPRWAILLGVLIIALGAIVGAWLFTKGQTTRSVVAVRAPLTAGQPISTTDLVATTVPATSELSTVDADRIDTIAGSYATMNLPAGALLTPQASSTTLSPGSGKSIVGVGVKPGQLPARGLAAGEQVRVVVTNNPGAGGAQPPGEKDVPSTTTPGTTWPGVVVDAGTAGPSGLATIDVSIDSTDAAAVAAAAGTGSIAIIVDGQG